MAGEDTGIILTEEELYQRIEDTLLAMPEVSHLTQDGFSYLVQAMGQAFGYKGHRGVLIRRRKDGTMKVDISLALHQGCQVNEAARYIQMVVKNLFASTRKEPVSAIDVTITDMVK